MRRILLSIGLLLVVAACARLQERETRAAETQAAPAPIIATDTTPNENMPTAIPATLVVSTRLVPTALSAQNQARGTSGDFVKTVQVNGAARSFRLHVPAAYNNQPTPLVLNFHGYGSNATQEERLSAMSLKANQEGFIVAYPEGSGNPQHWGVGMGAEGQADLDFVRALIAELAKSYTIDSSRIYATGLSNGAEFSALLACDMADQIAAVASVAGGYFRAELCSPARPVAIMEFHGTSDQILPYEGIPNVLLSVPEGLERWAARNGCAADSTVIYNKGEVKGEEWGNCRGNADVVLYVVDGGGHSWPGSAIMPRVITTQDVNATDVMWEFFKQHPIQ